MPADDRIPRVLVVDDEPNIRELVQVALKFHGCSVSTAVNGKDALRQAEAGHPDLIVLDVVLPDMDGFEVCRRLRAGGNEVPVIFLTARDTSSDTVTGLAIGGDDYVTKPFSVEALVARVRAVLRRASRTAGPQQAADAGLLRAGDLPAAASGPGPHPGAAAGERVGLGLRGRVTDRRDLRQLPAPQARPAGAAADPHPARRRVQPAPARGTPSRPAGIEDAGRAFDRFHRAARHDDGSEGEQAADGGDERSGTGGGSGLGLSIVQAIARAHGGQAVLESWPGRGTRVRIWLPTRHAP